jgi:hypothetical protein
MVRRAADALAARADDLDRLTTVEMGKPIGDARGGTFGPVAPVAVVGSFDEGQRAGVRVRVRSQLLDEMTQTKVVQFALPG